MKKVLAMLLVAVMVVTGVVAALSVSAETVYTDKVDLLPASADAIEQNSSTPDSEGRVGKVDVKLSNGSLSLTRAESSTLAWPSIKYDVKKEVDLSETPYLHMSFATSGEGERGVNGFIYYTANGGEEQSAQISDIGGNGINDFRDTDEMYVDLAKYLEISGKITITKVTLSVYGGIGETITWNALAFAKEGADAEPEPEPEPQAPVTVNVTKGNVDYKEEALEKLIDGNRDLDATAFGSAGLVSFQNKGFKDGNATVEIVVDLGEVKTTSSINLDFFRDDDTTNGSFISLPSALDVAVSTNGKDFYGVNAGNAIAIAEGTNLKMNTITVDFSTRMVVSVRYIKATVTFDNEWIFLSEIGIGAAAEGGVPVNPSGAFAYTEGLSPRQGIGLYTEAKEYDLSNNDDGVFFLNSQIVIATWDETTKAYKIRYNKVNPWPNGHTDKVTLKEGEILLAIMTQGNINKENEDDTIFAGVKWLVRGLKNNNGSDEPVVDGDYILVDKDAKTVTFLPSDHDFSAPVNPAPGTPGNNNSNTTTEAPNSDPQTPTGDAGVLLFAVLSVVALAGIAVAVKVRG